MRKTLIIALGIASLGAIVSVQTAAALDAGCTASARTQGQVCVWVNGTQKCMLTANAFDNAYNNCSQGCRRGC